MCAATGWCQATITLDLFAVLLAGATAMLPIFARDILHVGASGLGFLAAGMGIGAASTALWFSIRPMKTNVGVKMLIAVVVFGLAILTFGLSNDLLAQLRRAWSIAARGGHGVGLYPLLADPAAHARCDARPGRRGLAAYHLGLE